MSKVLNEKVTIGGFLAAMGDRFQGLLATTMSPQEKLVQIGAGIDEQVQGFRVQVRQIGGAMRAIADPDTEALEPLEALKMRREKLVRLGGRLVKHPEKNKVQLGQLQQEIKGLEAQITAQQATYDTLVESYEIAMANYRHALDAQKQVRENAPAMLKAIKAHKDAVAIRERTKSGKSIDVSFMDELQGELRQVQAENRADADLERDLDATNSFNIDAALAAMDAEESDTELMAEFRAASEE